MKKYTGCSRRDFLKYSASAAALMSLQFKRMLQAAPVPINGPYGAVSPALTKFVDPLRTVGGTGIPLAAADATPAPVTGVSHYTIDIGPFNDVLHSDFQNSAKAAFAGNGFTGTKLWGYGQGGVHRHLGGIILAQRNVPVQITFRNQLPTVPIIPNDITVPNDPGQNRTAVHLHGGHVHWISDGGPFDWWAPDGTKGLSFLNNAVLRVGGLAQPNEAEYFYPNDQSARLMWYHDHAWGITRTNAYAGIATGYVLVDPTAEAAFDTANMGVPSALDTSAATLNRNFFYFIFQDKIFCGPAGPPAGYAANAGPGDLFYASTYDPALFGPAGIPTFGEPLLSPFPVPSCVPEFFGDTILVNGAAYPTLEVEARPIRVRMLNACSSRFLNPRLVATMGTTFPNNAEPNPLVLGPGFIQIGTEGGYLPGPVVLKGSGTKKQLLLAPAERADILIDFSAVAPGTELILYNDAPGPYPGGSNLFDFFPGNGKTPQSTPGYGPNTRTLMKFRVIPASGTVKPLPATINTAIANLSDPLLVNQVPGVPNAIPTQVSFNNATVPVARVRTLTLNEGFDEYGRLAQFLGPDTAAGATAGFYGRKYLDPYTEDPAQGSVEVWQIANLTADTHPIHFHLCNVQILYRQAISLKTLGGTFVPAPTNKPMAPDANELGYKETVRMNPGEVTVVIMKFDIAANPPNVASIPPSPRTGGAEYVWHCHILEHEEHDMMRPVVVI